MSPIHVVPHLGPLMKPWALVLVGDISKVVRLEARATRDTVAGFLTATHRFLPGDCVCARWTAPPTPDQLRAARKAARKRNQRRI